jgi:TctA family transporter
VVFKAGDMPTYTFAAFALGVLSRLRTGVLQFFKAEVTVKTYALVVIPLAFGAFLIALLIPETSAFVP